MSEKRYYTNGVTVPNSINAATPDCTTDVTEHSFQRIRLGYGNTTDDVKLSIDGKELAQGTDYTVYKSISDFDPSSSKLMIQYIFRKPVNLCLAKM